MLQLHVLKLIKSQVPFCGRKWRQCRFDPCTEIPPSSTGAANMKVITSIYLNCRPELRDEWLTGTEVDDVSDAQVEKLCYRSQLDIMLKLFRPKSKPFDTWSNFVRGNLPLRSLKHLLSQTNTR